MQLSGLVSKHLIFIDFPLLKMVNIIHSLRYVKTFFSQDNSLFQAVFLTVYPFNLASF